MSARARATVCPAADLFLLTRAISSGRDALLMFRKWYTGLNDLSTFREKKKEKGEKEGKTGSLIVSYSINRTETRPLLSIINPINGLAD